MVYILAPANYATGGPELLHQLGYKLNLLGFEASMYYMGFQEGVDPVCPQYKKYHVPTSYRIKCDGQTVVIVPELGISLVQSLKDVPTKLVIWWLSVDNAHYTEQDLDVIKKNPAILHLAQSMYAYNFLTDQLKIAPNRVFYLSDYINSDFLLSTTRFETKQRSNTVLFNPQKGFNRTSELISGANYKIKWQALRGLMPSQMIETMKKAKVYIDFGNHPGKDRIPREAALCGCCVITNKNGSAGNAVDAPIPDSCKFGDDTSNEAILNKIYDLLEHYEDRVNDYKNYIDMIQQEYGRFERDALTFFESIYPSNIPNLGSAQKYSDHILEYIERENYITAYRSLVKYKTKGYEINSDINFYETVIRMGLQEYPEAKLCALRGLRQQPDDYEMHLYLAEINLALNELDQIEACCNNAIKYSTGTPDEALIRSRCEDLFRKCQEQN